MSGLSECPNCNRDEHACICAEECDHEEYETDILTRRATCGLCGHRWYLSARELERDAERQAAYDKEQAYWNRVDEGRQRAKDREIE